MDHPLFEFATTIGSTNSAPRESHHQHAGTATGQHAGGLVPSYLLGHPAPASSSTVTTMPALCSSSATVPSVADSSLATRQASSLGSMGSSNSSFQGVTVSSGGMSVKVGAAIQDPNHPQNSIRARNVYVACLPLDFAEDELVTTLSQFGPVESCRVFSDTHKAQSSGRSYAFALFKHPQDADRAIESLNGMWLRGRKLQVRHSRNAIVQEPKGPRSPEGTVADSPAPHQGISHAAVYSPATIHYSSSPQAVGCMPPGTSGPIFVAQPPLQQHPSHQVQLHGPVAFPASSQGQPMLLQAIPSGPSFVFVTPDGRQLQMAYAVPTSGNSAVAPAPYHAS